MKKTLTERIAELEKVTSAEDHKYMHPESQLTEAFQRIGEGERNYTILSGQVAGISKDVLTLNAGVQGLATKLETMQVSIQQQNASLALAQASKGTISTRGIATLIGTVVIVSGVIWGILASKIENILNPLILRVTAVEKTTDTNGEIIRSTDGKITPALQTIAALDKTTSQLAELAKIHDAKIAVSEVNDTQSQSDRANSKMFDQRQMDINADFQNRLTELKAMFVESETQQRSNSQIRNLQDSRIIGLIKPVWGKLMPDVPFPEDGYYPDISLPKPQHSK